MCHVSDHLRSRQRRPKRNITRRHLLARSQGCTEQAHISVTAIFPCQNNGTHSASCFEVLSLPLSLSSSSKLPDFQSSGTFSSLELDYKSASQLPKRGTEFAPAHFLKKSGHRGVAHRLMNQMHNIAIAGISISTKFETNFCLRVAKHLWHDKLHYSMTKEGMYAAPDSQKFA